MFAQPEMADEKNYYKGKVAHHAKAEAASATGRRAWPSTTSRSPDDPKQIGFMPVEGTGLHRLWYVGGRWAYASALLDGFSDYILITIDLKDPKKPRARRQVLAAGHERRRRREGRLADPERPLRPAPRHHPRRHRLLLVARRLPRRGRRQGQGQPEAHHPQGLGAALRRRHAQRAAAPRPQPADRRRRDGARQPGGRLQADLGVRQPGEVEPDLDRHLPRALRQGLPQGRRPFRPAQRPREPARAASRARS